MSDQTNSHGPSLGIYFGIFFALMFFTAVTVAVAFVDLGVLNTVVALVIAGFKASLVIMFFMHLKYVNKRQWLVAFGGIFWLALLITFVVTDMQTRSWMFSGP